MRRRVSRRHAVSDARGRSAAVADRHRRGRARSDRLYLAVPLRRARRARKSRAATGATTWCGTTSASCRRATRRRTPATPAVLEVGALRTRLLLASDVTEAYACLPLAHVVECRADKQVVLDDSFIPTVLHARAATRLATLTTELLGLLHQRGEALGGRVAATGRGAAAEFADFLMLQAINRYEPLLAHFADSGALHPEELFQLLRVGGRRAGDVHDDVEAAAEVSGLSPRPAARIVRPGDRVAARVVEQGADADGDRDPDRAAQFGISVAIVAGPDACSARRCSSSPRAPTCRRRSCGAASRRSSRSVRSRRSAIWCDCGLRGVPVHPVAGRAATDSVSRRLRLFRARSDRRAVGSVEEFGRRGDARRGRVPGPGDGVLGDPQLTRGPAMADSDDPFATPDRDDAAAAARRGPARSSSRRADAQPSRRRRVADAEPLSGGGACAARHRSQSAGAGGQSAAAARRADARHDARRMDVAGLRRHSARRDPLVRGAGARVRRARTRSSWRRATCCAPSLDEAVLSTPWGAQSEWAQHPLLVAFHREAWGGEKFFEMLDRISSDPGTLHRPDGAAVPQPRVRLRRQVPDARPRPRAPRRGAAGSLSQDPQPSRRGRRGAVAPLAAGSRIGATG